MGHRHQCPTSTRRLQLGGCSCAHLVAHLSLGCQARAGPTYVWCACFPRHDCAHFPLGGYDCPCGHMETQAPAALAADTASMPVSDNQLTYRACLSLTICLSSSFGGRRQPSSVHKDEAARDPVNAEIPWGFPLPATGLPP
jgi:hypothetical protein